MNLRRFLAYPAPTGRLLLGRPDAYSAPTPDAISTPEPNTKLTRRQIARLLEPADLPATRLPPARR